MTPVYLGPPIPKKMIAPYDYLSFSQCCREKNVGVVLWNFKGKEKISFFFFFFFFYLLQNLKAEADFDCRKTKFGKKSDWNF